MGNKTCVPPLLKCLCWESQFGSVQSLSCVQLFETPWTEACQASLSITNSWSSNTCPLSWWCHPTSSSSLIPFSSCLQSFPASVFSSESVLCIKWLKYWNFCMSISPSNEYLALISFRMDWLDLLAVWGTLKSLLQHHSSKASIIWHSAFFMVQLSHSYLTSGKTIALTRLTFVGKVVSLLFNMLSRLLLSSKEQASLNFMPAVTVCSDFGAQENKVCHCYHCFPIYLPWSDGTGCHDLRFLNIEF